MNCGDLYARHLDCQWIDITGVPSGRYLLRLMVNPDSLVAESDHENNELTCDLELVDGYYGYYRTLTLHGCSLSGMYVSISYYTYIILLS